MMFLCGFVFHMGNNCKRFYSANKKHKMFYWKDANTMIGAFIISLSYLYIFLVRKALEVFQCVPIGSSMVLQIDPSVPCTGPVYDTLWNWAVVATFGWAIGIPLWYAWIIFSHSSEIQFDQSLRQRGLAGSREANPYFDMQKRYKQLYTKFKPEYYYWILVILARKIVIISLSTQVRTRPMFAATSSVFILFVAFCIQLTREPYRIPTMSGEETVAALHQSSNGKVTLNALEASRGKSEITGLRAELRSGGTLKVKIQYLFDYNKLENMILFSCVFVLLSGIMFKSTEFDSEVGNFAMSVFVICVVGGSSALCAAAVLLELGNSVAYWWRARSARIRYERQVKQRTKEQPDTKAEPEPDNPVHTRPLGTVLNSLPDVQAFWRVCARIALLH